MILRIWHGWTTADNADDYGRVVDEEIVPSIIARGIPGLRKVDIVRRRHEEQGAEVEFVTIMTFTDWAAVEAFAGPGGTTSFVPPAARRVLSRYDEHSQHYDLVGEHGAEPPASWTSETSTHRYFVVDAFTDAPLEGNQVAIFLDAAGLSGELMQRTARELNLSETVFVLAPEAGGDARIRIFTPAEELPFAGHPVLGSAVLLGELLGQDVVRLETRAGVVPVEVQRADGHAPFGWMEQPLPTWSAYPDERRLLSALGVEGSGLPVEAYENGPVHVYVELDSEAAVAALRPDFPALAELAVCVNCFAGAGRSWKTRMFAPALGVNEDPATGSAAGPLAVHLARHGRTRFDEAIEIRQGEEVGRPSLLHARAAGSGDRIERVSVGGAAVVVARGRYRLT